MRRVLVIDDDLQIRQMVRQMLERSGYEVDDAPDGQVGIDIFRKKPADLVITDIIMPEKEGIGTILELKREKGAVILAHFYQESEVQDLADTLNAGVLPVALRQVEDLALSVLEENLKHPALKDVLLGFVFEVGQEGFRPD